MLQSISYLNIKPFETFSGRVNNRKTTITSFEHMLRNEKTAADGAAKAAVENTVPEEKEAEETLKDLKELQKCVS